MIVLLVPNDKLSKIEIENYAITKKQLSQILNDDDEKAKVKELAIQRKLSAENGNSSSDIYSYGSSSTNTDRKTEFSGMREKVLYEKEKKKREEQEKVEKALQAIRRDNFESRRLAADRKTAQYRPSDDLVSIIPLNDGTKYDKKTLITEREKNDFIENSLIEEKKDDKTNKQFKITEDYDMHEEEEVSEEEHVIPGILEVNIIYPPLRKNHWPAKGFLILEEWSNDPLNSIFGI